MSREKFKSKNSFILASIGAAVGLGNALRFPGLCAKYGGGTFLFIYFVALVVLGIPILNAEIALGRKFKGGAPVCMSALTPKSPAAGRAVGWASSINSVFTAVIYAGICGWIISMLVNIVPLSLDAEITESEISEFFFKTTLNARYDGVIDGISPLVICSLFIVWVLMFFCLKGGAKTLSAAAKFTVIIPVALLICLAFRGFLYDNSSDALSALFVPDFSQIASPELWITALGQVFFSLSVVVGIMPVYGAYLPEGTDIFKCSLVIAAADFFVSVLASIVLFTTLYGCGLQNGIGSSGITTAFAVYPVAITQLFGTNACLNAVVGVLFYASLAMMSVQSAVSMLEAFISPYSESRGKSKKSYALKACLIGGVVSIIFATSAAPLLVDVTDRFINFYNVLALGIAECLIIGFSRRTTGLTAEINKFTGKLKMPEKLLNLSIKYLSPAILVALVALEFMRVLKAGSGYPAGILIFGTVAGCAVFVSGIIFAKCADL